MKQKSKTRYLAEYFIFRSVVCMIDALPMRVASRLAEILAKVVVDLLPRKVSGYKVSRENLRTALGDNLSEERIHALVLGMWTHLFRMVIEIVQLPRKLRLYNCADVVHFNYRDETVRTLCTGRPVMMLSGHFGNWEMA